MYADHVKWRKEFDVAGIVKDFNFHERDLFLTLYPQGYHKTDKLVSRLALTGHSRSANEVELWNYRQLSSFGAIWHEAES